MALIKCKECGKMISDDAGACPQCGKPIVREVPQPEEPKPKSKAPLVIVLFLLMVGVAAGVYYYLTGERGQQLLQRQKEAIKEKTGELVGALGQEEKKEPTVLLDDQVEIKEDTYHHVRVAVGKKATVTVEYSLTTGPPIEVVTVDAEDFKKWEQNDKGAIPIAKLSSTEPSPGLLSTELLEGTYYVIVDNSNRGSVSPPANMKNDVATVKAKVTILEE